MAKFTFALPTAGSAGTSIDSALFSRTRDEDLTYTGNDSIVWDRVNATRLQRGLPGLEAIGYPRPPDETPAAATGETFTVEGPPGMTESQAREIFLQQNQAGSLVGLKSGDTINSATQAAGGLTSALSQLSQQALGFGGSTTGALTGSFNRLTSSAQALPTSDLLTSSRSLSSRSVGGINSVLATTAVTNGITAGDFARQSTALAPIGNLDTTQVKSALSQSSKLVAQPADTVSDSKGVGKYGLDSAQLETAGVLKSGTTSRYLAQDQNTLTSVLNSPAVWTGQDGINSVDDLLASPAKQDKIQQNLMSTGLSRLQEFGVPTDALDAQALAGTALNAAKSPQATLDWTQGKGLPANVKTAFDTTARDSAFAVNFGDTKVSDAMTQTFPGVPAEDTVDRATLNAASRRVTGDPKIPEVTYTSVDASLSSREIEALFAEFFDIFSAIEIQFKEAIPPANTRDAGVVVDGIREIERLASELEAANSYLASLIQRAKSLDPPDSDLVSRLEQGKAIVERSISRYDNTLADLRRRLTTLTGR